MRNLFMKQDGYVLVTVLVMFVIFSILGLSLMSYTIGSQQFSTANTEFIESKADAEARVQEAHARILKGINEINNQLAQGYLRLEDVISRISRVMNDARKSLDEGGTIKTKLIKDGVDGAYLQRVDIEVDVEGSDRKFVRTLTVSTIADVFQYSAVTPGNMVLNGPSYLKGDVQAGGNLYLDDHGYYTSRNRYWVPSTYAGIDGDLRVMGDFHYKSAGENIVKFTPDEKNLEQYFSISPRLIEESVQVDKIDVETYINTKKNHSLKDARGLFSVTGDKEVSNAVTINRGISLSEYERCDDDECDQYYSDLKVTSRGSLKVKGDLFVSGNLILEGNLEVDGSIYIQGEAELSGELSVDENGFIYVGDRIDSVWSDYFTNNSTIEDLTLENGAVYVDGSLNIKGDIDTNSAIYISYGGRIEGIENKSGTLIILSEGPLTIANNNLYISPDNENLKTINAFFYTNSNLDMYGVGSNLVIKGGIYGKNITLNAMKGDTKKSGVGERTHFLVGDTWFEKGQKKLPMNTSRFIIDYGEEIISNPPDGIPTVDKITVKEIDSHFYDE